MEARLAALAEAEASPRDREGYEAAPARGGALSRCLIG
jgi:hypothetical protein